MALISLTSPALTHPRAKFRPVNNNTQIHHTLPTYASYQRERLSVCFPVAAFCIRFLLWAMTTLLTPSSKTTATPFSAKNTASPLANHQSPPNTPRTAKLWQNALLRKPPRTLPTSALKGCDGPEASAPLLFPTLKKMARSFRSIHSPGQTPYTRKNRANKRCQP